MPMENAIDNFHHYKRRGELLLYALLTGLIGIVLLGAWTFAEGIIYFPIVILGLAAFCFLFSNPRLNLIVVLLGFVSLTDYNSGFQVIEVLYGLYFITYLGHWFITRIFITREPFVRTATDRAVLIFLIAVTCYIPIAVVFNGNIYGIFAEWIAFVLLSFYFPIKEEIRNNPKGATIILAIIGFIGVYIAFRNLLNYRAMLSSATQLWQVARGRVVTNDNLLMISSLYGLILFTFSQKWRHQVFSLGAFVLFFSGLILTQSRGYWLAFLLGAGFMFVLLDSSHKKRLILVTFGGTVSLVLVAFFFLQDIFLLVTSGLAERLLSLQTATTADISLVNRFRETATVWELIRVNPILGYGMGVGYDFFDITMGVTETDAFVHNGYISLWFKYGIIGLGLVLFMWIRSIYNGVRAFRTKLAPPTVRLIGLFGATTLTAFLLSSITSSPFFLNDTLFAFGLLLATAEGAFQRTNIGTPA